MRVCPLLTITIPSGRDQELQDLMKAAAKGPWRWKDGDAFDRVPIEGSF